MDILPDEVLDLIEPGALSAYKMAAQGTDGMKAVVISIAISLRRLANAQEVSLQTLQEYTNRPNFRSS